ncbi:GDNF family receptor alpha-1 [Myotis brandtii]|uniref:GDNF family receptor alpha-1 n=1 Tax=Myotis brandtii TaxID=109478 RepID=S7N9I3_MYOBR|nr:GDNF family receptor alpha-1 [Myotis brandtii]
MDGPGERTGVRRAEVSGGDRLDCVKASDQCLKEQSCSTKYRTLRQCVAGKETNFSLTSGLEAKDECRSAMEALKQKSLYSCRCKRGMKKEKNCLRIYWSMYQSLQGNDLLEDSPYEPVNSRLSDIFRPPCVQTSWVDQLLSQQWPRQLRDSPAVDLLVLDEEHMLWSSSHLGAS